MTITKNKIWKNNDIEIALVDCSKHSFPRHYHDEFVIGVNVIGGEAIWLDGQNFEADLEDITLYNPGEIQSANPLIDNWKFISIYISDKFIKQIFGDDYNIRFTKSILRSNLLAKNFRYSALQCLSGEYSNEEIEEYIIILCNGLLRSTASLILPEYSENVIVHTITEKLLSNLTSPPSIAELASEFSMTPVQMIRTFKKSKGLAPFQWLTNHRLNLAKKALTKNSSIVTVSYDFGFSDQAHFTRRFKTMFGLPPGAYKKAMK